MRGVGTLSDTPKVMQGKRWQSRAELLWVHRSVPSPPLLAAPSGEGAEAGCQPHSPGQRSRELSPLAAQLPPSVTPRHAGPRWLSALVAWGDPASAPAVSRTQEELGGFSFP